MPISANSLVKNKPKLACGRNNTKIPAHSKELTQVDIVGHKSDLGRKEVYSCESSMKWM